MAKHILSCSFGKDSIATALLALQHGEPLDELVYCEVMFSEEISGELPEHNRFIHETAIPYFEQRGIPTRVLRSEKTYLSCFYHVVTRGKTKGMLSGFPLSGRCTIQRDCKLPPIKAYQKALPPDTVQYIGIAADEPTTGPVFAPGFCCRRARRAFFLLRLRSALPDDRRKRARLRFRPSRRLSGNAPSAWREWQRLPGFWHSAADRAEPDGAAGGGLAARAAAG